MRNWLALTVEDQLVAQEGLVLAVVRCLGLFYEDNIVMGSRDPEWLQGALNVLIGLFRRYGLVVNSAKSKVMTCHPGKIRSRILEEAVGRLYTGRGVTYREWLRIWIP